MPSHNTLPHLPPTSEPANFLCIEDTDIEAEFKDYHFNHATPCTRSGNWYLIQKPKHYLSDQESPFEY